MVIKMLCVENGIQNIGFRKLTAAVKEYDQSTKVYYVTPTNQFSLLNRLLLSSNFSLSSENIDLIAEHFKDADVVGVSHMSECAVFAENIINAIKAINSRVLIVTGGAHSRIYPEDTLRYSDVICESEGELAFVELLEKLRQGLDPYGIPGLRFKDKPINTSPRAPICSEDLNRLPKIDYSPENVVFDFAERRFTQTTGEVYRKHLGMHLSTMWTRGCPNKCSYCYNSSFLNYHPGLAKVRYPSPRYIVDEIKSVLKIYPFVSWVSFLDDGMMAIKTETLEEFAEIYSQEIGLPFYTYGAHPNYVTDEKVRLLVEAGSIFFRMGIQNYSPDVLKIYNRNTTLSRIDEATHTLAKYSSLTAPPGYDVILDNDFLTKRQLDEHITRLYDTPRPYVINIHSLRIVPGSLLEKNIKEITECEITEVQSKNLLHPRATLYNMFHYILAVIRPPRFVLNALLAREDMDTREFPALMLLARLCFLIRRAFGHMLKMDFAFVSGAGVAVPYALWKIGVLQKFNRIYARWRLRKLSRIPGASSKAGVSRG